MFNIQEKTGAFQKEMIHAVVRVLLYGISRALTQQIKVESSRETNQKKILFDNFITLLSSSEIKKNPLAYYADKLCVSPRYLTMVCRDVSRKTAYDWISEYVQNDVRYYLLHSNLTIKEIAMKLGFCNLSFFGKYVRENFGVSPSEYRKQLKEE
jgi:AraC-like DNA-binding protein